MQRKVLYITLSDSDFAPRTITMLESLRKFDVFAEFLFVTVGEFSAEELGAIRL
jgi:hypothetical protein